MIIYLLQQVGRCDTVLSCIAFVEFNQAAVLSIPHLFIIQLEYLPINCLIWVHTHSIYISLTSHSSPRSSFYGLSSVNVNYYYYMTCDMKFTTANKIHPIILLFQESQQLLHCSIMRLPSPSPAPPLVGLLPLSLGGRMGL